MPRWNLLVSYIIAQERQKVNGEINNPEFKILLQNPLFCAIIYYNENNTIGGAK